LKESHPGERRKGPDATIGVAPRQDVEESTAKTVDLDKMEKYINMSTQTNKKKGMLLAKPSKRSLRS